MRGADDEVRALVEEVRDALKDELKAILEQGAAKGRIWGEDDPPPNGRPAVILVVGVNGTGKTTSVAKLAQAYREDGEKVVVAAADTFRAAAIEQLKSWGEVVGADVVSLEEIENSAKFGQDRDAALATLVDALNERAGADEWAFVPSPAVQPPLGEQDVIRLAFVYKPAAVEPVGGSEILVGSTAFGNARQPLAQEFRAVGGVDQQTFRPQAKRRGAGRSRVVDRNERQAGVMRLVFTAADSSSA